MLGLRVTHRSDGRSGFVVSRPESNGTKTKLVRIAIEGTTRYELWPLHLIQVKPTSEQHIAMGGKYESPAGYPLFA